MSTVKNYRSEPRSAACEALRAMVAAAPGIMHMMTVDGEILAVSRVVAEGLALPLERILGGRIQDLYPGSDVQHQAMRDRALDGPIEFEPATQVLPNGGIATFEMDAWPWFEATGERGGFITIVRDITAKHVALADLERTQAMLQAVIESVPAMVSVMDLNSQTCKLVNGPVEAFMGQPREQLVGAGLPRAVDPAEVAYVGELIGKLERTENVHVEERRLANSAGDLRSLVRRTQVIRDQLGGKYLLIVTDDVTEQRKAEVALQEALIEAEAANDAKSAFLANMSHEIRTPLNGVLGMAQAMAHEALDDAQRGRLQVIQESGHALMTILNDLLDLSKVEAGKLELESIPFYPQDTLTGAVANFRALAAEKGVRLTLATEGLAQACIGDPARLRQIVSNLISNALKFTETGEVAVDAHRVDGRVRITISDTGPGIPEDALPRLFDRFIQADSSTTRRFGGTGLGLAICRELTELMGGELSACNRPEGGASFNLWLPLQITDQILEPIEPAKATPPPEQGLRILAAEDNPVNQQVLAAILGQVGLEVAMVGDGAEAVELFAAGGWDLILMDVQMPVMDGEEATRRIRALERTRSAAAIPIIGLTANAMAHQKAQYLACGMDRIVAKPLNMAELFGAIEAALAPPPEAQTRAAG